MLQLYRLCILSWGKLKMNEHLWPDTSITWDCTRVNRGPKLSKNCQKPLKKAKWSILTVETGDFSSGFVLERGHLKLFSLTLFYVTTVTCCDHFPTIGTKFFRGGPTTPTPKCLEAVRSLWLEPASHCFFTIMNTQKRTPSNFAFQAC
jgi:hypothetical protein